MGIVETFVLVAVSTRKRSYPPRFKSKFRSCYLINVLLP